MQLLSLHGPYGKPDDLREFVNEAHKLGIGIVIDVVLHHGAVDGNELWDFDGWGGNYFGEGGVYHEVRWCSRRLNFIVLIGLRLVMRTLSGCLP